MQILLLLSALLSAVTGAFGSARPADAPVNQVEAQQFAAAALPVRADAAAPTRRHATPRRPSVLHPLWAFVSGPAPSAPLTSVRWLQ